MVGKKLKYIIKKLIRECIFEQDGDILNKHFSKINLSTEDVFNLIEYQDNFRDLYPGYDSESENEYEEDYYFKSKKEAYSEVNDILSMFESLPNPLTIYRSIKVNSEDEIDYSYLGDSWSFDKQSAINFAKNQAGGNILLIGKTNFDNINWKNTLKVYFLFSNTMDSFDENEVTIIDSDEITDIKTENIKLKSH